MLTNKRYLMSCRVCGRQYETSNPCECPSCQGWARIIDRWGICTCGREVSFQHFTNTCDCGRDYNSSGQELAPRSQWGEETGESLADIMMADTDPWGGDY